MQQGVIAIVVVVVSLLLFFLATDSLVYRTLLVAGITFLILRMLVPAIDPRPALVLHPDHVEFRGLYRAGTLRGATYPNSELTSVSGPHQIRPPKVGKNSLVPESTERSMLRWQTPWLEVRTSDRLFKIYPGNGEWTLERVQRELRHRAEVAT